MKLVVDNGVEKEPRRASAREMATRKHPELFTMIQLQSLNQAVSFSQHRRLDSASCFMQMDFFPLRKSNLAQLTFLKPDLSRR